MKALIALLFGICLIAIAIYLHVNKDIDKKTLSIVFALAIIGGLSIANYDVLKKWKGLGLEVETARDEIQGAKNKAIDEIQGQVEDHKQAISMLVRSANDFSEKLDNQKALAEALVEKAEGLESEIKTSQKQLLGIKQDVFDAKETTQTARNATEELAKILTRIAYFQVATKNQFGTPQAKKAIQKITDDLNLIVNMMIPDNKEREAFVKGVMDELSENKK